MANLLWVRSRSGACPWEEDEDNTFGLGGGGGGGGGRGGRLGGVGGVVGGMGGMVGGMGGVVGGGLPLACAAIVLDELGLRVAAAVAVDLTLVQKLRLLLRLRLLLLLLLLLLLTWASYGHGAGATCAPGWQRAATARSALYHPGRLLPTRHTASAAYGADAAYARLLGSARPVRLPPCEPRHHDECHR